MAVGWFLVTVDPQFRGQYPLAPRASFRVTYLPTLKRFMDKHLDSYEIEHLIMLQVDKQIKDIFN